MPESGGTLSTSKHREHYKNQYLNNEKIMCSAVQMSWEVQFTEQKYLI